MKDSISSNPKTRLSKEILDVISKRPFFDTHCHIFNKDYAPDGFLGFRVPFKDKFLKNASNFLKNIVYNQDSDKFSNLGYFVELFNKKGMEELFLMLLEYYSSEQNVILCPLMMDMRQGIKGKINKNYPTQISDMKNLRDKYPGKILPFIALDPNNPQATDIFIKAFSEDNFFGVKIYPSLGYLPTHPILMNIFSICEEKNIPIVTHCGGAEVRNSHKILKNIEGIEYNHNKTGEFIKIENNKTKFLPIKNDYKYYFNNPINWYPVLKNFPKLRLNFAHFGSTEEWVKLAKGKNNSWVLRIMDFMYNFEYVYADLSFNIFEQKLYDFVRKKIEDNKTLREKTLYGSDWYMIAMKGHFRNIKTNFITSMGDALMEDIARNNPLRFFGI